MRCMSDRTMGTRKSRPVKTSYIIIFEVDFLDNERTHSSKIRVVIRRDIICRHHHLQQNWAAGGAGAVLDSTLRFRELIYRLDDNRLEVGLSVASSDIKASSRLPVVAQSRDQGSMLRLTCHASRGQTSWTVV